MTSVIKYGIVGFSKNQFDKKAAFKLLDTLFAQLKAKHPNESVEIVSGYTDTGVPKIAYNLAEKYGFTTVGFSAKQALEVSSGVFPADKVFLEGEKFGDESEAFINYIDRLIRIGGGKQSRKEVALFKEKYPNHQSDPFLTEHEVESGK